MIYFTIIEKDNGFYEWRKEHHFHTAEKALEFFKRKDNKFFDFYFADPKEYTREEINKMTYEDFYKKVKALTPKGTYLYVTEPTTIEFED